MLKKVTIIVVCLVVILVLAIVLNKRPQQPSKLDGFASCLKDKGAVFYGAFWCPHCKDQKDMFGRSSKYLPYVECSTPNGQSQLQICKDKIIKSYPTWDFVTATGTERVVGKIELVDLAKRTNCELPVDSE